eukprot:TRINITY_DN757_c0_g1_i1.p1 TRINITY_DN757_c0_g1~~TRINITY_DN757_c0_g1_i1.p1  ORF type:complete len:723 (-),score=175.77 TRINITY_DN757_c0_g1_i1:201-2369(-)
MTSVSLPPPPSPASIDWEFDLYADKLNALLEGDPHLSHLLPLSGGKDLIGKLKDGLLLAHFLNAVPGHESAAVDMSKLCMASKSGSTKPLNHFQCVENNAHVLSSAKAMGINTSGLGPMDFAGARIVEKKKPAVLNLFRQINELHEFEVLSKADLMLESIKARRKHETQDIEEEEEELQDGRRHQKHHVPIEDNHHDEEKRSIHILEVSYARRFMNELLLQAGAPGEMMLPEDCESSLSSALADGNVYCTILTFLDKKEVLKSNVNPMALDDADSRNDAIMEMAKSLGICSHLHQNVLKSKGDIGHLEFMFGIIFYVQDRELARLKDEGFASAREEEEFNRLVHAAHHNSDELQSTSSSTDASKSQLPMLHPSFIGFARQVSVDSYSLSSVISSPSTPTAAGTKVLHRPQFDRVFSSSFVALHSSSPSSRSNSFDAEGEKPLLSRSFGAPDSSGCLSPLNKSAPLLSFPTVRDHPKIHSSTLAALMTARKKSNDAEAKQTEPITVHFHEVKHSGPTGDVPKQESSLPKPSTHSESVVEVKSSEVDPVVEVQANEMPPAFDVVALKADLTVQIPEPAEVEVAAVVEFSVEPTVAKQEDIFLNKLPPPYVSSSDEEEEDQDSWESLDSAASRALIHLEEAELTNNNSEITVEAEESSLSIREKLNLCDELLKTEQVQNNVHVFSTGGRPVIEDHSEAPWFLKLLCCSCVRQVKCNTDGTISKIV